MVLAFFKSWDGKPQIHVRYGQVWYRFDVEDYITDGEAQKASRLNIMHSRNGR